MSSESNRRHFLKLSAGTIAAVTGSLLFFKDFSALAETPTELVNEKGPMATALKYHASASNAPKDIRPKATKGTQFCNGCNFYSGEIADKKNGKIGKCQILENKYVKSQGWCLSWTPKPK